MELRVTKTILDGFKADKYFGVSFGEIINNKVDNGKCNRLILHEFIWRYFGIALKVLKMFLSEYMSLRTALKEYYRLAELKGGVSLAIFFSKNGQQGANRPLTGY